MVNSIHMVIHQFMMQWYLWHKISPLGNLYLMDMEILGLWTVMEQLLCVIQRLDYQK